MQLIVLRLRNILSGACKPVSLRLWSLAVGAVAPENRPTLEGWFLSQLVAESEADHISTKLALNRAFLVLTLRCFLYFGPVQLAMVESLTTDIIEA